MTTEDLMKLLGDFPEINPSNYGDDDVNALNAWGIAAHTALEALGREVERLTQDRDEWKDSTIAANQNAANEEAKRRDMQEQRGQARAELAAIRAQEPVAWMYLHAGHKELTFTDQRPVEAAHPNFAKSTPLYASPVAKDAGLVADGWKPIETAPKDGTMFLAYVSADKYKENDDGSTTEFDVSEIDFCQWTSIAHIEGTSPSDGYWDNMMSQIGDSYGVTHWMPLPASPKIGGV